MKKFTFLDSMGEVSSREFRLMLKLSITFLLLLYLATLFILEALSTSFLYKDLFIKTFIL